MITPQDKERMEWACGYAKYSNDPNCKVGAVLHHKSRDQTFYGCNEISTGFGRHEVLHAEHTLLWGHQNEELPNWDYFEFKDSEEAVMHITKAPCLKCCQEICDANIKRVVCPKPYEINPNTGQPSKWYTTQQEGLQHLKDNGVTVDYLEIKMVNGTPMLADE